MKKLNREQVEIVEEALADYANKRFPHITAAEQGRLREIAKDLRMDIRLANAIALD